MSTEILISPTSDAIDDDGDFESQGINHTGEIETDSDTGSTAELHKQSKPRIWATKLRGMTCCHITALLIAVVMMVFSIAMMLGCYQCIIYFFMKPQLVISEGSEAYELWKVTSMPLLLKFYVFNLTNPDELKEGYKPIVNEIGPYVWREFHEKQNITFHPNKTVTYYQQRWWVWDHELSGTNSPDDIIVTLNIIPVTVARTLRGHAYAKIVSLVFLHIDEELITMTTAEKILFDGVEDPLLDWMQKYVVPENATLHFIMKYLGQSGGLAGLDKFAWFYKRNMSLEYDGLYNMKTGADNLTELGLIDWWNKERETPFYKPPCNHVQGSAGEIFPPNQEKDKLVFFSSDLCMSATLFYKEKTQFADVSGSRYTGTNHTFANGSVVPGNECYCVNGTCAPTGLLNVESCRMGAPVFTSFPHFLHADPFLLDGVIGLAPNESKHAFNMDIIPELGVPMNVMARLQINIRLQPSKQFSILNSIPDMYFPMLWFEILFEMTPELANRAKIATFILRSPVTNIVIWLLMLAVALVIAVVVITLHCRKVRRVED